MYPTHLSKNETYKYRWTAAVSMDSVCAVSVICDWLQPKKKFGKLKK
jgi:hypothetical protein